LKPIGPGIVVGINSSGLTKCQFVHLVEEVHAPSGVDRQGEKKFPKKEGASAFLFFSSFLFSFL
jgi:hypothetical protein